MHDRSHERARRQVQGRVACGDGVSDLLDWERLARQHRLVTLQLRRLENAQIRRHDVADPQRHDIAWNERRDIDRKLNAVPPNQRLVMDVAVQRRHRIRGSVFVHESEADAEHDDCRDDRRIGWISGQARDPRRAEEQEQERIAQLTHENAHDGHPRDRECVCTEQSQALRRLGSTQPVITGAQARENDLRRKSRGTYEIEPLLRGGSQRRHVTVRLPASQATALIVARTLATTGSRIWPSVGSPTSTSS